MHSLVIMILFGKGSAFKKLKQIAQNTLDHAINLGSFVFTFKLMRLLLKILSKGHRHWHNFLAGTIGATVFLKLGKNSLVNQ